MATDAQPQRCARRRASLAFVAARSQCLVQEPQRGGGAAPPDDAAAAQCLRTHADALHRRASPQLAGTRAATFDFIIIASINVLHVSVDHCVSSASLMTLVQQPMIYMPGAFARPPYIAVGPPMSPPAIIPKGAPRAAPAPGSPKGTSLISFAFMGVVCLSLTCSNNAPLQVWPLALRHTHRRLRVSW